MFNPRMSICVNNLPITLLLGVLVASTSTTGFADDLPGEGRRLGGISITQQGIEDGEFSLHELRKIGRLIFSTPFNKVDGYGDGTYGPGDNPTTFGERPSLQGNGTFLRVNGLDAQSCLECHFVLSMDDVPMTFGVGGLGGANSSAMFMPTVIDVADTLDSGEAAYNGRFINPPFVFGAGGVELAGKEMTHDLQNLRQYVLDHPGEEVELLTKGVSFGTLINEGGTLNFDGVEGIDDDLVVKPFGRKGSFATTRGFDLGAFQFHMGIQAVEDVGSDTDPDDDGVMNELLVGELSAVAIFNTTLERPVQKKSSKAAKHGKNVFEAIGCAECHTPKLTTHSKFLSFSFPEIDTAPFTNVFYQVDLTESPTDFEDDNGGISVPLFSDLKRHDMGPDLAESFGIDLDAFFITARLWGIADSGPYLHDSRALTIGDAILAHGGEAQVVRDTYAGLSHKDQFNLLSFLQTLRTPSSVGKDLDGGKGGPGK